jgi:tRNA A-37 threonylcarbamoyl transferase component Bud32
MKIYDGTMEHLLARPQYNNKAVRFMLLQNIGKGIQAIHRYQFMHLDLKASPA